jgi:hypothetical protein
VRYSRQAGAIRLDEALASERGQRPFATIKAQRKTLIQQDRFAIGERPKLAIGGVHVGRYEAGPNRGDRRVKLVGVAVGRAKTPNGIEDDIGGTAHWVFEDKNEGEPQVLSVAKTPSPASRRPGVVSPRGTLTHSCRR